MKSGSMKVQEWQQQQMYGLDSGIQSGANTINDDEMLTSRHYTMTTTVTRENPGESGAGFRPNVTKIKATSF